MEKMEKMKAIDRMEHNQEILTSRVGGFGSSDADLFYKIGCRGLSSLTETDKKRILVAKGKIEQRDVKTQAMESGHDFEDFVAKLLPVNFKREYYQSADYSREFKTFAHFDFYDTDQRVVYELKYSKYPDKVLDKYFNQLQWFYLMGAKQVMLYIGDANNEEMSVSSMVEIPRNDYVIDCLKQGIVWLSEVWNNEEYFTLLGEAQYSALLPFEQRLFDLLDEYQSEYEAAKKRYEEQRQKVLEFMEDNQLNKLSSQVMSVTYTAASTTKTFDKKALQRAHPEINIDEYTKEIQRAASITLKVY